MSDRRVFSMATPARLRAEREREEHRCVFGIDWGARALYVVYSLRCGPAHLVGWRDGGACCATCSGEATP